MTGYAYTYDLHQDSVGFEHLTPAQQEQGHAINRDAHDGGLDRLALLRAADMPAADKAALATVWGGAEAAEEFQR